MEDKTQIKKVVLEVEGKEIVLTVNGAKKLKEALNELFGREVIKEIHLKDNYIPYYKPFWSYGTETYKNTCTSPDYLNNIKFGNNTLTCSVASI